MSSIKIKASDELDFPHSIQPPGPRSEIDLLALLEVLWNSRYHILGGVVGFALLGLIATFLLPQRWTSTAVVTPVESTQWTQLRQPLIGMQVLGVDTKLDSTHVFNRFIKKFRSQQLLEEYITSSPMIMDNFNRDAKMDTAKLHRAIVAISEKIRAQDDRSDKKNSSQPWSSWTLSFTGPNPEEAQQFLAGYIQFIADKVMTQTTEEIQDALTTKIHREKESLALELAKLANLHDTRLKRLNYSLEIAKAAGISKPAYSQGQTIKDDPDFPVALGADGLSRKLDIEKSLNDVSELYPEIRNRQYQLTQLEAVNLNHLTFPVLNYQLPASLPVKKDGPGRILIVVLGALLGGLIFSGNVLLRQALAARHPVLDNVQAI